MTETKKVSSVPKTSTTSNPKIEKVVVHPLVLLSATDHYERVTSSMYGSGRVVGVALGSLRNGVLDVSNSFAVPFEEDRSDRSVWFLDHDYLEQMFGMFRKVNARERIVGWYHTADKLQKNDIIINEVLQRYNNNAILLKINVNQSRKDPGIPVEAFHCLEEVHDDGTPSTKTFEHLTVEIGAEEAEEVGVEHLLRDVKDGSISTLSQKVSSQIKSLGGLETKFANIARYLNDVLANKLPINHQILANLQNMLNLLPDVSVESLQRSLHTMTNDQMMVLYVSSMLRTACALHDLINNKLDNRAVEIEQQQQLANKLNQNKVVSQGDNANESNNSNKESSDEDKSKK